MTLAEQQWDPFGIPDQAYTEPDNAGIRWLHLGRGRSPADGQPKDRAGTWLRNAMIALGLLAAAAAVVSFAAQYHMVYAAKGVRIVAALEAGIPDTAAVVFAALGIALALHGKRALRPRALNVAAVATSIFMNFAAAEGTNWRTVAIWVMPSVAYAVASDTAIGVIRAYTIARQKQLDEGLADEGTTPLDVLGGFLLWVLRLSLAPGSTLAGFRSWVVTSCPVAPGTRAQLPPPQIVAALPAALAPGSAATPVPRPRRPRGTRGPSKRAQLIAAYEALKGSDPRYGDRSAVSPVAQELAEQVGMTAGGARTYLYRHLDGPAVSS